MKFFPTLLATFCVLMGVSSAHAAETDSPRQNAVKTLKTSTEFIMGPVEFYRFTPPEAALRTLAQDQNAAQIFERLLDDEKTGKPGQLYALIGLKWMDEATFKKRIPPYLQDEAEINEGKGCIGYKTPIAEIAKRIEAGEYKRAIDD